MIIGLAHGHEAWATQAEKAGRQPIGQASLGLHQHKTRKGGLVVCEESPAPKKGSAAWASFLPIVELFGSPTTATPQPQDNYGTVGRDGGGM